MEHSLIYVCLFCIFCLSFADVLLSLEVHLPRPGPQLRRSHCKPLPILSADILLGYLLYLSRDLLEYAVNLWAFGHAVNGFFATS